MTFLSKLGQILLKGTHILAGLNMAGAFPPSAKDEVQTVLDTLERVTAVVVQVEAFGQALGIPGPDKAKAVAPAVAQILLQSSMMTGRKIANPDLWLEGNRELGAAVAKILNSLDDQVDTKDRTT